mmetsp:Transcript_65427/g.189574  ORF Transcript_65427/g.189574 Transcript_65427/m.189574 type:complete len:227 (-) Transcript_65427:252-932(-)
MFGWSRGGSQGSPQRLPNFDVPISAQDIECAKLGAQRAYVELQNVSIEQGPAVLRFMSVFAALGSLACTVLEMTNPVSALLHPIQYILCLYLAVFALVTLLFEAQSAWIENVGCFTGCQNMLIRNCPFLTTMGGRGLFYIFEATLWLSFADSLTELLEIAAAAGLALVGLLHVAGHFGIMPHHLKQTAITKLGALISLDFPRPGMDADELRAARGVGYCCVRSSPA